MRTTRTAVIYLCTVEDPANQPLHGVALITMRTPVTTPQLAGAGVSR
ncbi:hypothetical protein [Kitasatospora griseola]